MKLLHSVVFGLFVSVPGHVPKQPHASVEELSYFNLIQDLKSLKSRVSKFEKPLVSKDEQGATKAMNWREFLQNHPEYIKLYSYEYDNGQEQKDMRRCRSVRTGPIATLISKVGPMRKMQMEQMISRHPKLVYDILSSDMENIRTFSTQISRTLQLNETQMQKMNRISNRIKTYRGNIWSIFYYLKNSLQMDEKSIVKIILKRPELLNYSALKLVNSIEYFTAKGFSREDIIKMIVLRPVILAYSTSSKLEPILNFFEKNLQIENYHKIVSRYPQVFSLKTNAQSRSQNESNIDGNTCFLMKRAAFLQCNMELKNRSPSRSEWLDVSFVVSGFPPVLWLSEDNLLNKVNFLREEFKFDDEELRDVLVTFPQLLGLSVEDNLRPTIDFLQLPTVHDGAGLSKEDLKEFVLYQPSLLAYSLEGRIKPRVRRLNDSSIRFDYCPPYLMSYSDTKFDQW